MLGTRLYGKVNSLVVVFHLVELLISRLQLSQDMLCLVNRRLRNIHLLKPAYHALRTGKMAVIFLVGRRTDKADIARLQIGFQHVRRIHRPLTGSTSAYQGVYLVNVHDVVLAFRLHTVHDHLDAVLEVAAILRASQQRTHVQLIHLTALQTLGHPTLFYHSHQSPDQCRLAHAGLAHMQRIVLIPATQHLNGPLQFLLTANQRILLLEQVVHARHKPFPGGLV